MNLCRVYYNNQYIEGVYFMNQLTIIICIVASVAISLFSGKQAKDYKKHVEEYKATTKDYKKVAFLKFPAIMIGIMTVLAIIIMIYGLSIEADYIWIGLLLIVMCITEFISLPQRFVLYYNESSFLGENGKVLYRNIKGYEFRKILPTRGSVTIKLYSGDDIIVTNPVYSCIQEQIALAKAKKKELKESKKKHAA